MTLSDYVPDNQDDKLRVIQDMALLIGPALSASGQSPRLREGGRLTAWLMLSVKLEAMAKAVSGPSGQAATRLRDAVMQLTERPSNHSGLVEFENRLLTGLPGRLDALSQSLQAEAISLESLPKVLRERQVANDGQVLVEVFPENGLRDRTAMRAFVEAVRKIAPDAVGSPVIVLEAGRAVLYAFLEACVFAVVCIVILLWIVFRRCRDVALVFAPLVLAGLWTLAVATLLGLAFNLANVIVLPLLFGLGVAGGVHLVVRTRDDAQVAGALLTSTPRAVFFSALTTIASFGSISLSGHPGTASMGMLLTLALIMTLVATLVFLPALLVLLEVGEHKE